LINRLAARLASSRLSTASIVIHFTRAASSRVFGRAASASEHKTTDPPGRDDNAEWNVWASGRERAEYRDDRDRDRQEVEQNFRGVVDGLVSLANVAVSLIPMGTQVQRRRETERDGERDSRIKRPQAWQNLLPTTTPSSALALDEDSRRLLVIKAQKPT
jgi:hypothetical protein